MHYVIKRNGVEQKFSLEDYNDEKECFMNDFTNFMMVEVVTSISIVIYHNRDVKHLAINLKDYSVKRD